MAKPMGMMSGCYFIGRSELLEWINGLLAIDYDKVEDTANGAAFCQIIDAIHPGTVALGRVNFDAITEAEMVENYKVLQDAFQKNGITQHIDVVTLCKGRYMAALELFQWIHGYFEQMGGAPDYDAAKRRKEARCKEPTSRGRPNKKPAGMAKRQGGIPLAPAAKATRAGHVPNPVDVKKPEPAKVKPSKKAEPDPVKLQKPAKSSGAPPGPVPSGSDLAAKEAKKFRKEIEELKVEVEQMKQERDFYYEKLRKIEDYCQENENETHVKVVLEILYEPDEEKGFLPPEEDES
jgi:RP/EB family microtubule-associated protein